MLYLWILLPSCEISTLQKMLLGNFTITIYEYITDLILRVFHSKMRFFSEIADVRVI